MQAELFVCAVTCSGFLGRKLGQEDPRTGAHVPLALPGRRGRGVECALNECLRSTAPMSRARVARVDAGYLGGWQHEQRSDDVHRVGRVVVSPRVSPRGYHHGTRLNDDPRSPSCLSARHLIMAH